METASNLRKFRAQISLSGEVTFMCTQKLGESRAPWRRDAATGNLPDFQIFARNLRKVTRWEDHSMPAQAPSTNILVRRNYMHL